jgi:hypothetical protein
MKLLSAQYIELQITVWREKNSPQTEQWISGYTENSF